MFEPNFPIKQTIYSCGRNFVTEPLEELTREHQQYGLIHSLGIETILYILCGTRITKVAKIVGHLAKNQKKGGQSAPRFQRKRLNIYDDYVNRILEEIPKSFGDINIIIAGCSELKDVLTKNIKPMTTFTITEKTTLDEIVDMAKIEFEKHEQNEERELINYFLDRLDDDKILIGEEEVLKANENQLLKRVVATKNHEICQKLNCDIIEVSISDLDKLGGFIGELWY